MSVCLFVAAPSPYLHHPKTSCFLFTVVKFFCLYFQHDLAILQIKLAIISAGEAAADMLNTYNSICTEQIPIVSASSVNHIRQIRDRKQKSSGQKRTPYFFQHILLLY